ncbi:NifU family protein [bacterium]|nr:NifU family protein [candidate division CSSED10-310 bacterium]
MLDEQKVRATIDRIRPSLQMDGGDIDLVGIEENQVKVRLKGACGNCPGATMTLKFGVERLLRKEVSEDIEVVSV